MKTVKPRLVRLPGIWRASHGSMAHGYGNTPKEAANRFEAHRQRRADIASLRLQLTQAESQLADCRLAEDWNSQKAIERESKLQERSHQLDRREAELQARSEKLKLMTLDVKTRRQLKEDNEALIAFRNAYLAIEREWQKRYLDKPPLEVSDEHRAIANRL